MAAKQVIISLEQLPLSMLPEGWSMAVKLDWQDKTNGLVETGEVANAANSEADAQKIRNDAQDVTLSQHDQRITDVTDAATKNATDIQTNVTDISKNVTDIQQNLTSITTTDTKIDGHIASNSQHGATGDIVGNQDYAQLSVGGVVNLAAEVSKLPLPSSLTLDQPPATYNQRHMSTVVDVINTIAATNKVIYDKINELIEAEQAAKQMAKKP